MPEMNMVGAINDALRHEMRKDPRVLVMGEDVGKVGGVFRVTQGLFEEFGEDRVIDTPLSEGGIIGTAIGMALYGMVPVPEIQFADFIYPAFDQIVSELAKMRYRSGGEYASKIVIRSPVGGGIRGGHYHSQSPEALFIHTAGLKVVCPSNPYDAKGLLLASIRDPDPVLFFEPKRVYRADHVHFRHFRSSSRSSCRCHGAVRYTSSNIDSRGGGGSDCASAMATSSSERTRAACSASSLSPQRRRPSRCSRTRTIGSVLRDVVASMSVAPSPRDARATAAATALCTAKRSLPSTATPGTP